MGRGYLTAGSDGCTFWKFIGDAINEQQEKNGAANLLLDWGGIIGLRTIYSETQGLPRRKLKQEEEETISLTPYSKVLTLSITLYTLQFKDDPVIIDSDSDEVD